MKKSNAVIGVLMATILGGTVLAGCGGNPNDPNRPNKPNIPGDDGTVFNLPNAPDGAVIEAGGNKALFADSFRLDFVKAGDGYGVNVVDASTLSSVTAAAPATSVSFKNETPAMLNVRGPATTLLGSFDESSFSAGYSTVTEKDYGYLARATVTTQQGSSVLFEDAYYISAGGTFAVSRRTEVITANVKDIGFQSVYSFADAGNSKKHSEFDYFIPSILYKDSQDMVNGAIASGLNLDRMYVKETRTGLPLSMLRNKVNGRSIAIAHLEPQISVNGEIGGGFNGTVNNKLQFGSIGYTINKGVSVDFCYPSSEGPTTYDAGSGWAKVYHKMEEKNAQEYRLSILPETEDTYAKSMTETFKAAYTAEMPTITNEIDIDKIYDYNIEVFADTYKEFGTGVQKAAGVPWSISLKTGNTVDYSFQMGFVGQQIPVGYHLMSQGYAENDNILVAKGKAIVDFWTSAKIMGDKVPVVWWDPADNESAGQSRGYPSFLRCFVDGAEGMIDACKVGVANGMDITQWRNAVIKIGNFLVENQNDDGSYYRAYNPNGTVCTDSSDNRYQGTSKRNTPVAVRLLAKMYEFTGEEKYKTAALKAADYSYEVLYKGLEKYVGGTPDNPNTVDKEASIYAMYCFNAAYILTKDAKYLEAAQHGAVSAMSWVYCYDFACPSSTDNTPMNPFTEGGVSGFSIIATGHSAADNFSAYMYYEMYKLYVFTGDTFYLHAAQFLQNNTKLSTDYNGERGWKYRAMGPEASVVCEFSFGTVGVWLPWSGIANIEPIANMRLTFGNADIAKITSDRAALAETLWAYGNGGRLNKQ